MKNMIALTITFFLLIACSKQNQVTAPDNQVEPSEEVEETNADDPGDTESTPTPTPTATPTDKPIFSLTHNSTSISSGDTLDIDLVQSDVAYSYEYVVANTGDANLTVAMSSPQSSEVSIPAIPTVAPNSTTTVTVTVTPNTVGDRNFTLNIDTNDDDVSNFNFKLGGSVFEDVYSLATSTTGVLNYVDAYLNSSNVLYIAYQDTQSNGGKVGVKKYESGSWSSIATGFSESGISCSPSIVEKDGVIYLAYYATSDGNRIYVKKYSGGNWTQIDVLSNHTSPKLIINNGIIYLGTINSGDGGTFYLYTVDSDSVDFVNGRGHDVQRFKMLSINNVLYIATSLPDGDFFEINLNYFNQDTGLLPGAHILGIQSMSSYIALGQNNNFPYLALKNLSNDYKLDVYKVENLVNTVMYTFDNTGRNTMLPESLFFKNDLPYMSVTLQDTSVLLGGQTFLDIINYTSSSWQSLYARDNDFLYEIDPVKAMWITNSSHNYLLKQDTQHNTLYVFELQENN